METTNCPAGKIEANRPLCHGDRVKTTAWASNLFRSSGTIEAGQNAAAYAGTIRVRWDETGRCTWVSTATLERA